MNSNHSSTITTGFLVNSPSKGGASGSGSNGQSSNVTTTSEYNAQLQSSPVRTSYPSSGTSTSGQVAGSRKTRPAAPNNASNFSQYLLPPQHSERPQPQPSSSPSSQHVYRPFVSPQVFPQLPSPSHHQISSESTGTNLTASTIAAQTPVSSSNPNAIQEPSSLPAAPSLPTTPSPVLPDSSNQQSSSIEPTRPQDVVKAPGKRPVGRPRKFPIGSSAPAAKTPGKRPVGRPRKHWPEATEGDSPVSAESSKETNPQATVSNGSTANASNSDANMTFNDGIPDGASDNQHHAQQPQIINPQLLMNDHINGQPLSSYTNAQPSYPAPSATVEPTPPPLPEVVSLPRTAPNMAPTPATKMTSGTVTNKPAIEPWLMEAYNSHLPTITQRDSRGVPKLYSNLQTFWVPQKSNFFMLFASSSGSSSRVPNHALGRGRGAGYKTTIVLRNPAFFLWDPLCLIPGRMSCPEHGCNGILERIELDNNSDPWLRKVTADETDGDGLENAGEQRCYWIIGQKYRCSSGTSMGGDKSVVHLIYSWDNRLLDRLPGVLRDEYPVEYGDIVEEIVDAEMEVEANDNMVIDEPVSRPPPIQEKSRPQISKVRETEPPIPSNTPAIDQPDPTVIIAPAIETDAGVTPQAPVVAETEVPASSNGGIVDDDPAPIPSNPSTTETIPVASAIPTAIPTAEAIARSAIQRVMTRLKPNATASSSTSTAPVDEPPPVPPRPTRSSSAARKGAAAPAVQPSVSDSDIAQTATSSSSRRGLKPSWKAAEAARQSELTAEEAKKKLEKLEAERQEAAEVHKTTVMSPMDTSPPAVSTDVNSDAPFASATPEATNPPPTNKAPGDPMTAAAASSYAIGYNPFAYTNPYAYLGYYGSSYGPPGPGATPYGQGAYWTYPPNPNTSNSAPMPPPSTTKAPSTANAVVNDPPPPPAVTSIPPSATIINNGVGNKGKKRGLPQDFADRTPSDRPPPATSEQPKTSGPSSTITRPSNTLVTPIVLVPPPPPGMKKRAARTCVKCKALDCPGKRGAKFCEKQAQGDGNKDVMDVSSKKEASTVASQPDVTQQTQNSLSTETISSTPGRRIGQDHETGDVDEIELLYPASDDESEGEVSMVLNDSHYAISTPADAT